MPMRTPVAMAGCIAVLKQLVGCRVLQESMGSYLASGETKGAWIGPHALLLESGVESRCWPVRSDEVAFERACGAGVLDKPAFLYPVPDFGDVFQVPLRTFSKGALPVIVEAQVAWSTVTRSVCGFIVRYDTASVGGCVHYADRMMPVDERPETVGAMKSMEIEVVSLDGKVMELLRGVREGGRGAGR